MAEQRLLLVGARAALEPVAETLEKMGLRHETCTAAEKLPGDGFDLALVHERGFSEDGFAVCKQVRDAAAGAGGVVMLLTKNLADNIQRAIEAGADDVLILPADDGEIRLRLESVALGARLRKELELAHVSADSDTQRLLRKFNEQQNAS